MNSITQDLPALEGVLALGVTGRAAEAEPVGAAAVLLLADAIRRRRRVTTAYRSFARVPWTWEVEVLLDLPLDEAARRIPPTLAELAAAPAGTLLRISSLDWMASVLAGLDCGFAIRRPEELRAGVEALAARLAARARA